MRALFLRYCSDKAKTHLNRASVWAGERENVRVIENDRCTDPLSTDSDWNTRTSLWSTVSEIERKKKGATFNEWRRKSIKILCWCLKCTMCVSHGACEYVCVAAYQRHNDACLRERYRCDRVSMCVCVHKCFTSGKAGYTTLPGRPGLQLSAGACRSRDSITAVTLCFISGPGTVLWIWMRRGRDGDFLLY